VRLVFKDLPLDNHEHAFKAAEAGNCAHDQGKFWPLHDLMFERQRDGLAVDKLKTYAQAVGLDMPRFAACLDEGQHNDTVRADAALAQSYGIMATPSFFINGRALSGAQPFENFQQIIDDELARAER
jgi:protein-disulfide isomerase